MSTSQEMKPDAERRISAGRTVCPSLDSGDAAVDLDRYPIDRPDDPAYVRLVEQCRSRLSGPPHAAVVKGFVIPRAVEAMVAEAIPLRPLASDFGKKRTAWSPFPDPSLPNDHVRNRMQQDALHLVAGDLIPEDTLNKRLYRWQALIDFIADCLEVDELYNHSDPFQCLNLSFIDEGGSQVWHFDPADFVVSILLKPASSGGAFQYAAGLRSESEHDYDSINAVIDGDHPSIRSLSVDAGDLVLFKGRNTLHRVSPVISGAPRIISLLGFTHKETFVSSRERNAFNYGPRVNEVWEKYGLPDQA